MSRDSAAHIVRLPSEQVPVGGQAVVRGSGMTIAVFRLATGELYAVDNACPHEGYPLAQGTVNGCVVTCPWHNFKFDLTDGSCVKGEEAVTTFPVREVDGEVEVTIALPPVSERIATAVASLEEGLFEQRLGQVARETVRLLDLGMAPESLALLAARYDAAHAQYGVTHATPVAVDVLGLLPRYPGLEAVYPLMQPFDSCTEFNVRRRARPTAPALDPGDDPIAARGVFLASVEREDVLAAEGLLRGALAQGWDRATVEPWFFHTNARHFIGFGHGLIYTVKAFDLLEVVGWEHAADILPGVLVSIVSQTREELLPEWHWFRLRLDALTPQLPDFYARQAGAKQGTIESLVPALVDGTREEAFDAVTSALEDGWALGSIVDAMSVAAAERLLRFDDGIDRDPTIQHGWLTATHILTYVNALRAAVQRFDSPELLRLVYFGVRHIHHHGALDLAAAARSVDQGGMEDTAEACQLMLEQAVEAGDVPRSLDALAAFVQAGGEVTALRSFCEDLTVRDTRVRAIRVAHLLKTCVAAFDEYDALTDAGHPDALRPVQAFVRFAASPMRERQIQQLGYEAIRFIAHGKVPRTLA